jgi:CBS domain-containing protein
MSRHPASGEVAGTRSTAKERKMTARTTQHARVEDAMHRGVITCAKDTPLLEAARTMAELGVHCIVVTDEAERAEPGAPWGVLSDLDLVAATVRRVEDESAGTAAASPVVTVSPQETLDRAAQLMLEHSTDHLVVVDPLELRPVGVLSTLDIAAVVGASGTLEEMRS